MTRERVVAKILQHTLAKVRRQVRCSKCPRYATRMQRRGGAFFCDTHAPTTRSDVCQIDDVTMTLLVEKLDEIEGRLPPKPRKPRTPRPKPPKTAWDYLTRG